MIKFAFNISSFELTPWRSLWAKDFGRITKNKYLEMQLMREGILIGFELDLHWKGISHAGPELSIALLTFRLDIRAYDHRHWDYGKGTWANE